MEETSCNNYTSIDINKKDSCDYITIEGGKNKCVSNLNSGSGKSGYRFLNMKVACKLAIVAAIIFAGCGNFIALSATGTREVKYIIPDGYILLPKQNKGNTLTSDLKVTEAPLTKEVESLKTSQAMLSVTQITTTKETMKTSEPDCEAGWLELGSSCYYFSKDAKTWQNAYDACVELGSYLVEITSPEEDNALVLKAKVFGGNRWIGMSDIDKEGTWVWTSSKTITTYTNWIPTEPNNDIINGVDEDCCELRESKNFLWNDEGCHHVTKYICEKKNQ